MVGRDVEVGRGRRVCVEVGVRVTVEVGEAGIGVGDDVTVGDATKTTDAAVGSVGLGQVQLASPSSISSNVRLGAMNCITLTKFFMRLSSSE